MTGPAAAAFLIAGLAILAGVWTYARRRRQPRLAILMYHKIKPVVGDPWTVTPQQLDEQWQHLHAERYRAITCAELLDHLHGRRALPERPILITFDDAYHNYLEYALPLLEKHDLRATLFLPTRFIGGENEWDGGGEPLLSYDELRQMPRERIEFGIHSHSHGNYRRMPLEEIEADLHAALAALAEHNLPYVPAVAYPYGRFPRSPIRLWAFCRMLERLGLECGVRVGNRVNRLPPWSRYLLCRLDVRSEVTLADFRRMLVSAGRWTGGRSSAAATPDRALPETAVAPRNASGAAAKDRQLRGSVAR